MMDSPTLQRAWLVRLSYDSTGPGPELIAQINKIASAKGAYVERVHPRGI